MAHAKKLPSGNWRVNLYDGKDDAGKRLFKSFTAPTKKEAEYMAAEYALTRRQAADPGNMTVSEAVTRFIDTRSAVLSPATVRAYRSMQKNNFKSLKLVRLRDLTDEKIQIAVNESSEKHKSKTVRNQYALLTAALAAYHPNYTPRVKLPQRIRQEMNIPTHAQFENLIACVRGTDMQTPVILASCMGLRRSEICALTAADFDKKKKRLTVNKAMVRNEDGLWVIKPPKTTAGSRVLDVPDAVADIIDGVLPITLCPDEITRAYDKIRQGICMNVRFHDLRHYHASILLALGVPDKYAMKMMGHATPNMLKTVYQHTMEDKENDIKKAVNAAISGMIQHEIQHDTKKAP